MSTPTPLAGHSGPNRSGTNGDNSEVSPPRRASHSLTSRRGRSDRSNGATTAQSADHGPSFVRRQANHIGLRTRITVAFTFGSLVISLLIAVSTLALTRRALLQEIELRAADRVENNAAFVSTQLATREQPEDLTTLISSVQTRATPIIWLRTDSSDTGAGVWVRDPNFKLDDIPETLRNRVMWSYESGMMRTKAQGEPVLVVGVPITTPAGSYFEIESLAELDDTVRTLSIVLAVSGSLTTLAGALTGWWAARRALKPLTLIGDAARKIADGRLETRLDAADYAEDPELGPLVSVFNEMVGALAHRIDQDARFASDVSHELRSPLTTLTASVEVLNNAREELPSRAQKALDLLETDVKRFSQLVEDLLEISRFDAGAVRLEIEETVLSEQIRAFLTRTSASKATFKVSSQLDGRVVRCDSRRVLRIVANFVDNAAKYAGGAVAVSIEKEGEHVIIGVEDAGPGVPTEERSRIFSRFSRGIQGGARGSDTGSGLGLALAMEHARLHGGAVWVEDRPSGEQGSRFVVSLPLLTEELTEGLDDLDPFESELDAEPEGEPTNGAPSAASDDPNSAEGNSSSESSPEPEPEPRQPESGQRPAGEQAGEPAGQPEPARSTEAARP